MNTPITAPIVIPSADQPTAGQAFDAITSAAPSAFTDPSVDAPIQDRIATQAQNNLRRAAAAAGPVKAYADHQGMVGDEVEVVLKDMLNDLRHLADALNLDWADLAALTHYADEVA